MPPTEPLAWILIGLVAFAVSAMTLLAGFGLGTVLMPTFALFFEVDVAVALTAVVHALNNLFKIALVGRHARPAVVVAFGLPAMAAAFAGAWLLGLLAEARPLARWTLAGLSGEVSALKLTLGLLILGFALLDLLPGPRRWRLPVRWLPAGGLVSGFFGGLSGHQGALRAAFLAPLGLLPMTYAGTQAVLATLVDAARLTVYGSGWLGARLQTVADGELLGLLATTTFCAFAGAIAGRRLLPRMTVAGVRGLAGALLLAVGAGLASGII